MEEALKANQLTYIKERNCYAYCTLLFSELDEIKILLIFNDKGEFVKTETYCNNQLQLELTEEKKKKEKSWIKVAMEEKETMENILKKLVFLQNKKEIKIIKEKMEMSEKSNEKNLSVEFEIESLKFWYYVGIENSNTNELHVLYEEKVGPWKQGVTKIKHIPSVKGIKECIRKHPNIRVKYINELVQYEKNRL